MFVDVLVGVTLGVRLVALFEQLVRRL